MHDDGRSPEPNLSAIRAFYARKNLAPAHSQGIRGVGKIKASAKERLVIKKTRCGSS